VSPAEALTFAGFCYHTKRYATAAHFCDDAFAAAPRLAEDLQAANRYYAACSAAMAGAGKGEQESPLDEPEKARWRKQAIAWLRADLARWGELARAGAPGARAEVAEKLRRWKRERDLAGLRNPAAIASMPAEEQAACHNLWAEVDALLARLGGGRP
jgi:serine/threonine-protein kinase